jgi:hypothetical protein
MKANRASVLPPCGKSYPVALVTDPVHNGGIQSRPSGRDATATHPWKAGIVQK